MTIVIYKTNEGLVKHIDRLKRRRDRTSRLGIHRRLVAAIEDAELVLKLRLIKKNRRAKHDYRENHGNDTRQYGLFS